MAKINQEINIKLSKLSKIKDADFSFISLYQCTNSKQFLEQKEQNRIFIKNKLEKIEENIRKTGDRKKLASFKNDVNKIYYFIENEVHTQTHGIAIFACEELGIFETFQSFMPFSNELEIDSIPHLKQLAYQAEELESALVILFNETNAKIFCLKMGGYVLSSKSIHNDIHRFHKQGGWSQLRYQCGMNEEKKWHYKEIAKNAEELFDIEFLNNVILVGQAQEVDSLKKELPKRMLNKILEINSVEMWENQNIIIEKIMSEISKNENKKELQLIKDITEDTVKEHKSAVGVQDVAALAKDGRIELLVLSKEASHLGYKCGDCLYVSKKQHISGCPYCNGQTKEANLDEEIIRYTLRNDGEIEIVNIEAGDKLKPSEGIAALIRY